MADEVLKRERAGTYSTKDGRFTVEQSSSGWLVLDGEQTDDLGLPLTRGPYSTLDDARAAIGEARSGPQPTSGLAARLGAPPAPRSAPKKAVTSTSGGTRAGQTSQARPATSGPKSKTSTKPATKSTKPATPPPARPTVIVREIRASDGHELRALWKEAGFSSVGDDDLSLARFARRNPGLALVATEGARIVGSALGAWDGRRGWIYHVATAASHRRQGVATRLIRQVERGLRDLGCARANVVVRDENDHGDAFWTALGYEAAPSRPYRRDLGEA